MKTRVTPADWVRLDSLLSAQGLRNLNPAQIYSGRFHVGFASARTAKLNLLVVDATASTPKSRQL